MKGREEKLCEEGKVIQTFCHCVLLNFIIKRELRGRIMKKFCTNSERNFLVRKLYLHSTSLSMSTFLEFCLFLLLFSPLFFISFSLQPLSFVFPSLFHRLALHISFFVFFLTIRPLFIPPSLSFFVSLCFLFLSFWCVLRRAEDECKG